MEDYIVVSFSGGKDSTALLLKMIEKNEHINEVIYCDCYKEFPEMYKHIAKIKKFAEECGIKFTTLKSEKSYDYYMFTHQPARKKEELNNKIGYSWAGNKSRWCTSKLKTDIVKKYLNELRCKYNVIVCTGIAFDEGYRLERECNENDRHPLIEWGMDEKDCLDYCYKNGYNWGGLYEIFDRASCWCCPLQSIEELRKLWHHYPELWKELKNMDNNTWRNFRADYSVEELEKRFIFEKELIKNGEKITGRKFHQKLKEVLQK